MALEEVTEKELSSKLNKGQAAVFIYTAFCGTCQLAERMLAVVQASGIAVPIYKLNINYAPRLREERQISSVPCLLLFQQGGLVQTEYSMKSVDHLYALIKAMEDYP